jgi:hypothetical protein
MNELLSNLDPFSVIVIVGIIVWGLVQIVGLLKK